MSVASSPAASVACAGSQHSEDILTPTRKVAALLAQFDDSDSDNGPKSPTAKILTSKYAAHSPPRNSPPRSDSISPSDVDSDGDAVAAKPRGRIAARLLGLDTAVTNITPVSLPARVQTSNQEQTHTLGTTPKTRTRDEIESESDDDISVRPRKRMLLNKRAVRTPEQTSDRNSLKPVSPLFFPSPSARSSPRTGHSHEGSDSDELPDDIMTIDKSSKFLALVEKHRKQRLEEEAAEKAKKNARMEALKAQANQARLQRGSSPADDTDEESDISNKGAGKKLSNEARPTRKASKKALEEMNRETQRMSRNMQLAHQAKTRKKITKESLLARFNFGIPSDNPRQNDKGSTRASSATGSDTEADKGGETPPTSPLEDESDKAEAVAVSSAELDVLPDLDTILTPLTNAESRASNILEPQPGSISYSKREKGKERARSAEPTMESRQPRKSVKPVRVQLSRAEIAQRQVDSDDDLEIITSRGKARKFRVFESLPARKAKEMPSHLALRSLAQLNGSDSQRKSSTNAARLESELRKAARDQAREERQQRIEELKAKGIVIQTAEERDREQQEVEDLVEKAREEAAVIQKREREQAKKNGTYVKDSLDNDEDDSGDEDFEDEEEDAVEVNDSDDNDSDGDEGEGDVDEDADTSTKGEGMFDDEANEDASSEASAIASEDEREDLEVPEDHIPESSLVIPRRNRISRVVDDEDDEALESAPVVQATASPRLPAYAKTPAKTPQSITRSAKKQIPGLMMSDDLPIGLTQAFEATMAESQTQLENETQEQDTLDLLRDLPSPNISFIPKLQRLESIDMVSDSQPASQTQPLNINLSFSQSQMVPQSPLINRRTSVSQFTPSQAAFEPTQDNGYMMSPFMGSRFAEETPRRNGPQSTVDTLIVPTEVQDSPIAERKNRLRRGRVNLVDSDEEVIESDKHSAFELMRHAAKNGRAEAFDKKKSHAREIVDEAAEESEDEYAGLGGASDEDVDDEENEDDRRLIDEDTQVGKGDEAKLAGLYADRQRKDDEAMVSKLYKDLATGALRRKRGVNDDLDLSDEEDASARRREAKRREFARMRRELLKDEAVGKIAEDRKKEAFLKSIEDREEGDGEDDGSDQAETQDESQSQSLHAAENRIGQDKDRSIPLQPVSEDKLNRLPASLRRINGAVVHRKPATLAEIRDSVSFLIEEPDSQAGMIDLGLSDSEEEPEAYVDLDRHLAQAEADENADDGDDLGDFIVDDDGRLEAEDSQEIEFKKPSLPLSSSMDRPSFNERRTKPKVNVVNRLSLIRQASSSSSASGGNNTSKMAFLAKSSSTDGGASSRVPTLLRRATTNSSLGSMAGRSQTINGDKVSSTGVVTSRTERGNAADQKEFIRKGTGGRRNAVNYRPTVKEEKMSQRAGVVKKKMEGQKKKAAGFLGGLFRGDSWA